MRPLPAALRPLQRQRRFVLWKWEWRNGKWSKPPVGLDGSFVDATNPRHWLGYDDACDALASMPIGLGSGIGFALQGSGFGALDLDDCRAASSHINILSLWAHRLVKRADSYCEITPSGEGVRILGHADGGEVHRKFGDLEIFRSCRRYITISGDAINNAPLRGIDNLIDTLIAEHAVKPRRSIPPWLKIEHFGAVTGSSLLDDARALIELGRPLPAWWTTSEMIEALTGRYVKTRHYVDGSDEIATADGAVPVKVWRHPHPLGERWRRMICEGGLLQAEGRARAAWRGVSGRPLDIYRIHKVPLPGAVELEGAGGGLDDLMLAVGGWAFENMHHAAAFYPDLLITAEALRKNRERGRSRTFPYKEGLYKQCPTPRGENVNTQPPLLTVRYRLSGAGNKETGAVLLKDVANPRELLEGKLGPLAYFEIGE